MRRISYRRVALWVVVALAIAGAAVNAASAVRYGIGSLGDPSYAPVVEVPGVTQHRLLSQLEALQRTKRPGVILSGALWTTVGKLEQSYTAPTPLLFIGDMYGPFTYSESVNGRPDRGPLGTLTLGSREYREKLRSLIRRHNDLYQMAIFPDAAGRPYDSIRLDTRVTRALREPGRTWLMQSSDPTLLNAWRGGPSYEVRLRPLRSVHNHVVVVRSALGAGFIEGTSRRLNAVMLSRSEPDPLIRGGQIEAIGRRVLFGIVNPSPTVRLVVDFTATLSPDGEHRIPPVSVLGTRRVWFDVAGRGAARLVSPPLSPRQVGGIPLLALDMGADGRQFKPPRTGLLAWFGSQYQLDPRHLVGFVRDISVISEAEYRGMRRPSAISRFPGDLRNPSLEFSGIYDDGWASEHVVVWLAAPKGARRLTVRGSIPDSGGETASEIGVTVDGVARAMQPLLSGPFEIGCDIVGDGRPHKVELVSHSGLRLPKGDGRAVSALLTYAGFE